MTWVPCNCCDAFWCTAHKKHTHDCACPPAEEWTTDPYAAPRKKKDAMMYFVLDQAADGADYFYVAGGSPRSRHVWTTDVLLAALFLTPEDAARAVDELGDPGLLVAALPESFAAFVVERHNYTETLDALDSLDRVADDFIEKANAFARELQDPKQDNK